MKPVRRRLLSRHACVPIVAALLAACGAGKPPDATPGGPAASTSAPSATAAAVQAGAKPAAAKPPVPVVVATAELRDVPLTLSAIGTTSASALVAVRPRISATLDAVHVAEGDLVVAGAPLFTLDARDSAAAVAQAEAEVARTRALLTQAGAALERDQVQLALAQLEASRAAGLQQQGLASTQDGDRALAALRSAQAVISADQAAIATAQAAIAAAEAGAQRARLDLAYCSITAPIAGRTGAFGITPGNLASAGTTILVTIAQTRPMHIDFAVPADQLARIRAAKERGPVAIRVLSEQGSTPESATLDLIDNQIDQATAAIRLRGTCANAQERLWPGQQCRVEVVIGSDDRIVTVPAKAVVDGQRGPVVWVVDAERNAATRPVTVARTVDGLALIAKGLAAGDVVVVDGHVRLTKGATVVEAAGEGGRKAKGAK